MHVAKIHRSHAMDGYSKQASSVSHQALMSFRLGYQMRKKDKFCDSIGGIFVQAYCSRSALQR